MRASLLPMVAVWSIALAGCLRQAEVLRDDEVELVAWYAEDVAHGLERSPAELIRPEASRGLQRTAAWASPMVSDGRPVGHPRLLLARRGRWSPLRGALAEGRIHCDEEGNLVATPGQAPDALLRDELRQENLDREATLSMLLVQGRLDADAPRGERLRRAVIEVRQHHARRAAEERR